MATLEITSRQFRESQKAFFDLADKGRQILIRRRGKRAYILTPVDHNDFVLTPEALVRIEQSRQEARAGNVTSCRTVEESIKHLESL